jgi:hypothetical protein
MAESIGVRLVFAPAGESWFTGAARGKRLLVDIGRADVDVRRDSARRAAFTEAATRLSTVPLGTRLRVFGPWGADDASVRGFDVWNGRIVATVETSPRVDSIVRRVEPLPVAAHRADSAAGPATGGCRRESVPAALVTRADSIRDMLDSTLRATEVPPVERLAGDVVVQRSRAIGCFGVGRVLLIVSLRAGGHEFVRERVVVVDDSGVVHPLRVNNLRFPANDAIYAFDADGDGIDDLATRALADRAGAITILKLVDGRRLERLTSGFAWESR